MRGRESYPLGRRSSWLRECLLLDPVHATMLRWLEVSMLNTPHILIVDDDTALLQALPHTLSLRMVQVRVDTADSAPGALELIQEHDYDAIVSDIKMPGMDGLSLLTKLQTLRPQTPPILITVHTNHHQPIHALPGGPPD